MQTNIIEFFFKKDTWKTIALTCGEWLVISEGGEGELLYILYPPTLFEFFKRVYVIFRIKMSIKSNDSIYFQI